MQNSDENKEEILRTWLATFLENFRTTYENLDESEKPLYLDEDFRPPCQIEIFWLTQPEYQVVCVTKHDDRPDKEIIINGPYHRFEFADQLETILLEPRWRKLIPKDLYFAPSEIKRSRISYSESFASALKIILDLIKDSVFEQPPEPVLLRDDSVKEWFRTVIDWSFHITLQDFAWLVRGNISKHDPSDLVSVLLYFARLSQFVEENKIYGGCSLGGAIKAGHNDPFFAHMGPDILKMYGCSFYPPLWIGKKPAKSVKAQIRGQDYLLRPDSFELSFNNGRLVAYSNGFIATAAESRTAAKNILNIIMGVASKKGINCIGIDESEIEEVGVDPKSLKLIAKSGAQITSVRTPLIEMVKRSDIDNIPEVELIRIQKVIECAEKVALKQDNTSDQLLLWVESSTHNSNSEFFQAFVTSWILIETHLYSLLTELSDEGTISRGREKKLSYWQVDKVLEVLYICGKVNESQYIKLTKLRNTRNAVIHRGATVNRQAAKECLAFSSAIIKEKLNICS